MTSDDWLSAIKWDDKGLVTAIAQDQVNGRILMVAWMNRDALSETARTMRAVYWSRSRGKLWRKGEESGHVQIVKELRLDCDGDVILMQVDHGHLADGGGIACHTGRESCFYSRYEAGQWKVVEPVLKDPGLIYK
jgi:phosphoribosyl-AMP cyclohydrolase